MKKSKIELLRNKNMIFKGKKINREGEEIFQKE